ncbi:MAG: hypothetical protein JXR96_16040 [Deltaproteobacteria bacterium]|nr:hypothetical protein [Deltaproteobacteria bacterium]
MQQLIFGALLLLLGVWGIVANWYQFLDMLWSLLSMALLVGGIVAILAGLNGFKRSTGSVAEHPRTRSGRSET